GITLPPTYRAFLLHVANGWYSTSLVNDFFALELSRDYPQLADPFPATRADAAGLVAGIGRGVAGGGEGGAPREKWPHDGCLHVADFGCCNGSMLVVRGELRGQVWSYVEVCGPYADKRFRRALNFFEWFEEILKS